jgi:hypothetical protein
MKTTQGPSDRRRERTSATGADNTVKNKPAAPVSPPAWMSAFGGLRHLHKETKKINRILQREFEQVEEDERR